MMGQAPKIYFFEEHLFHQARPYTNQDELRHHLQILELTPKK